MKAKVYTRMGDKGETRLADGRTVRKSSAQIAAAGMVDELNAAIGLAVTQLTDGAAASIRETLLTVQHDLFDLGAALSFVGTAKSERADESLSSQRTVWLEEAIDSLSADLPPLRAFILPGGSPAGAQLHYARTVCRRSELAAWHLHEDSDGGVPAQCTRFLNRLADYLFVAARAVNQHKDAELTWQKKPTG